MCLRKIQEANYILQKYIKKQTKPAFEKLGQTQST